LLAVLGVVGVAGGIYWKRIKSGQIDSIAVLPLDMRSSDPEADHISDGIAERVWKTYEGRRRSPRHHEAI
jgi:TolB-like protein